MRASITYSSHLSAQKKPEWHQSIRLQLPGEGNTIQGSSNNVLIPNGTGNLMVQAVPEQACCLCALLRTFMCVAFCCPYRCVLLGVGKYYETLVIPSTGGKPRIPRWFRAFKVRGITARKVRGLRENLARSTHSECVPTVRTFPSVLRTSVRHCQIVA